MEASELRKGNLSNVSVKSGKGRTIVKSLTLRDICNIDENTGSFNFEPTPLTEEWLIKFGFSCETIQGNECKFRVYTKFGLVFNTIHGWWLFGAHIQNAVPLKYAHELQNLFFALTGSELIIKP